MEQLPEIFLEEGGRGTETHKRALVLWVLGGRCAFFLFFPFPECAQFCKIWKRSFQGQTTIKKQIRMMYARWQYRMAHKLISRTISP